MNVKDVAELKYKNIQGDRISFIRSKTKNTNRNRGKQITVFLIDFSKYVIEKYSNKQRSADSYLFPILTEGMNAIEIRLKVQNFTAFINDQIKKIAKDAGLNHPDISSGWSRHSYITSSINNMAPRELVMENVGHETSGMIDFYYDGHEDKIKKEHAEKLLKF
jgi:integrase